MKIGILTFPGSPSFGASLQMAALCWTLKKEKIDVEIINYINMYMLKKKHLSSSTFQRLKSSVANIFSQQGRKEFQKFEEKLPLYPKKRIHIAQKLKKISFRYDYLICGSDQVWNPKVTGFDLCYLLDFADNDNKKIAYAASFGLDELPDECRGAYKRELGKFHRISVREERGRDIVRDLIGKKSDLVIDPSMLLDKEEWEQQMLPFEDLPDHYIVKFIFNYDKTVEKWIKELSERTGFQVLTIGGSALSRFQKELFTGAIGPQKWLYIIKNADYVVTDSFHGAAFSIIFEKQFFVSLSSSTNSRLITLCNNFGLNARILPCKAWDDQIDYANVRSDMLRMREKSMNFLREAIGKIK